MDGCAGAAAGVIQDLQWHSRERQGSTATESLGPTPLLASQVLGILQRQPGSQCDTFFPGSGKKGTGLWNTVMRQVCRTYLAMSVQMVNYC